MKWETDSSVLSHLGLLHNLVENVVYQSKEKTDDLLQNGVMDYDHLWVLFAPGTDVVSRVEGGHYQAYRVSETGQYCHERKPEEYRVECYYVDSSINGLGHCQHTFCVKRYGGLRPIRDLRPIPLEMHQDAHLREKLLARGRRFKQVNRLKYQSFSGTVRLLGENMQLNNARVILDSASFEACHALCDVFNTEAQEYKGRELGPRGRERIWERIRGLPDSERILCAPTVRAFSLDFKATGDFAVDGLVDIEWDHKAFDRLVLHDGYKQLILAFVEGQLVRTENTFDDIIEGKGRGMAMLLQGPTGVGKTLTAESVAETMSRPLYTMSAAELGESANEIEDKFGAILRQCVKWEAVLLLDECDVFLEKRSGASIRQNRIVAVFLRLLEYYQGCLIMTSNRIKDFDPAFESRIDLTINYPPLDTDSRLQIWQNFLHASQQQHADSERPERRISEGDMEQLASVDLDGRQIKNIVKTATLLANKKDAILNIEHIIIVLRAKGIIQRSGSG